jgi:thiol-disulfide isomerase/thioredoxin
MIFTTRTAGLGSFLVAATLFSSCGAFDKKADNRRTGKPPQEPTPFGLLEGTHKSSQRLLLDEAVKRARANGKLVLVRATGSWCGPCLRLDEVIEASAEAKEALTKVELLVLDEVFYERRLVGDWLPFTVVQYPSFFIYDTSTDQWHPIMALNPKMLTKQINAAVAGKLLSAAEWRNLAREELRSHKTFDDELKGDENSYIHYSIIANAINSTAWEDSVDVNVDFLKELVALRKARPEVAKIVMSADTAAAYLVTRGLLTPAAAEKQIGSTFNADPDAAFYRKSLYFSGSMHFLNATKGPAVAAAQCSALAADVFKGEKAFSKKGGAKDIYEARCLGFAFFNDLGDASATEGILKNLQEPSQRPTGRLKAAAWLSFATGDQARTLELMKKFKASDDADQDKSLKSLMEAKGPQKTPIEFVKRLFDRNSAATAHLIKLIREGSKHPAYDYATADK